MVTFTDRLADQSTSYWTNCTQQSKPPSINHKVSVDAKIGGRVLDEHDTWHQSGVGGVQSLKCTAEETSPVPRETLSKPGGL